MNSGDTVISLEDMFDESESSFFPLTVVRVYSAYIHKRRTMGPVGVGWHLSLWYAKNSIIIQVKKDQLQLFQLSFLANPAL